MTPEQQKALALARARRRRAEAEGRTSAPSAPSAPEPEDRGLFRRVDDAVRGVADMATLGFADEISAGLGTGFGYLGDYDAALQAERDRDASGGWERLGGQVAGAFLIPGAAARTTARAAGQGAILGGTYGFGSGEGGLSERSQNAAVGGMLGGAAGGLVHKGMNMLANRAARSSIPDEKALRQLSQAGYDAADAAGVIVRPEGMRRIATDTVNDLTQFGYHPQIQPRIAPLLSEMERLANTNTTYKGLDTLRKMVSQVANSSDGAESAMATRIIGRLDDYMMNLPADDVVMGNAAQASAGIRQGRDNWARLKRSELVDTARIKAERRAAGSGTGGNVDNTLRQNIRSILDNPRRSRGMTEAEKVMAEKVNRGTAPQNALRHVGRLSPTTGGLSALLNLGATAYNPLLAIPGAIGMGAKAAADHMTQRNVQRLAELIRSGGKTAEQIAKEAAQGIGKDEIVRRIMGLRQAESVLGPAASRTAAGLMEYVPY